MSIAASACCAMPWLLCCGFQSNLFSSMALGYQTDLEASFWASCVLTVSLASIGHPCGLLSRPLSIKTSVQ